MLAYTFGVYLLYECALKMILIMTNVILSLRQNMLLCACVSILYIENLNGAKSALKFCAVQENKSTCSCAKRFIYSYYTDVCSILCVYNIIRDSSVTDAGEMRKEQQTVCSKHNKAPSKWCSVCLVHRLEKLTSDEVITRSNCQTGLKIRKKNELCFHASRIL